jgi:hypothetical protein
MRTLIVLLCSFFLIAGCGEKTYTQSGTASATCSGVINIGCNATARNTVMPSPDEALALGVALLIFSVILLIGALVVGASLGAQPPDGQR